VKVFDFATFLNQIGKEKYWYTKYKDLGDLRLAPDAFVPLSEKLLRYVVDFLGATKKCLVTDLDNTLWKGIVGEDGAREVVPNKDIQNYLLELSKLGTILAINSKNNPEDAFETIDNHPDMVLRKNNFAAWRINWQDKAQNIRELAIELNLGLDSFVFIDDSSFEMNLVRDYLPEVAVMPPELIKDYSGFQKSSVTKEDERRGEMYQEEKKREEFKTSFGNIDDYLKNLEIKIKVAEANSKNIPRVSQLTQKTNQFNVTTRRYSEDDIRNFIKNGSKIWTLEVYRTLWLFW
jgi:FkbH-like protein